MLNKVKIVSIILLMIFSFYYTQKVAIYVQNETPFKKEILTYKEENNISSINAKIDGDTIIPGMNGLSVNVEASYNKMKTYNVFNETRIVYEEKTPTITIKDYPEKIITSGNKQKNSISIIISNNNKSVEYLKKLGIKYTYIHTNEFCIFKNENYCNNKKPIVKISTELNNTNFIKNIKDVNKGSIVYLDDNLDEMYIDVLVKHINFYGLNVLNLKDHLSESNHI